MQINLSSDDLGQAVAEYVSRKLHIRPEDVLVDRAKMIYNGRPYDFKEFSINYVKITDEPKSPSPVNVTYIIMYGYGNKIDFYNSSTEVFDIVKNYVIQNPFIHLMAKMKDFEVTESSINEVMDLIEKELYVVLETKDESHRISIEKRIINENY